MPVTDDGTSRGKPVGIVTFVIIVLLAMIALSLYLSLRPHWGFITAAEDTTLKINDIIWDKCFNTLPIVDENGHPVSLYSARIMIPTSLLQMSFLDDSKRYMVGAGINTQTKRPCLLLVEAGRMFCASTHLRVT